jgi:hypothetical protein
LRFMQVELGVASCMPWLRDSPGLLYNGGDLRTGRANHHPPMVVW